MTAFKAIKAVDYSVGRWPLHILTGSVMTMVGESAVLGLSRRSKGLKPTADEAPNASRVSALMSLEARREVSTDNETFVARLVRRKLGGWSFSSRRRLVHCSLLRCHHHRPNHPL